MFRMKLVMVCIGVLLLGACASSQPEVLPGPSVEGVVVSVKNSGMVFPAGTTFSWSESASQFYRDERIDNSQVQSLLRDAIEKALVSRGYKVVEQGGEFEIACVAALSRSLSDVEINQRFGVNPGMLSDSKDNEAYEKGTVVIDVDDPRSHQTLWRSALQGYVVFDMPEDDRQRRVTQAVERIFTSFPAGY